jgi:hypothetical protein
VSAHDSRNPLAVAGIPFIHEGDARLPMPEKLSYTWEGIRVTSDPIRVRHTVGEAQPTGLTPLLEVDAPLGAYYLDRAGNVAIGSRAMEVPGFRPQLMHTRRKGFEYEIQYSEPAESTRLQWAWHRALFMLALPLRQRGLTVHAAGFLLPGGSAVLCPGISGTGKSTLARTLQQHGPGDVLVFSDDRVAVTRERGSLHAWGTPWYSSAEAARAADGPLAALVFVTHGSGARLEPIAAGTALRRVMRTIGVPFWDRTATEFALQMVEEMVVGVPCFEFIYAPDPSAPAVLIAGLESALVSSVRR